MASNTGDYNSVNINPQQLEGFVQSVQSLNMAINLLAGKFEGAPGAYKTAGGVRAEEELEGGGEYGGIQANQKMTQAGKYAREEMQKFINSSVDKRIAMLTSKKIEGISIPGKGVLSNEELAKQASALNQEINDAIVKKFTQQLNTEGTGKISRILDAIEESGVHQLRFGELPLQDVLRAAGTLSQKYYNYSYDKAQQNAAKVAAAGGTPSAIAQAGKVGLIARGLGMIGPGLTAAAKVLGPAEIIGEEARQAYEKTIGTYRELTSSGQLTGQGTMAGFAAKFTQPLSIWQPFGRIGFGTAQEIVQNAREQGFTGPIAGRVEQGMANVISNLGIQVGQATEFFTQSMREGGMSVGQVTQEMNKFHDATFNLNMNINDYTAQILEATNSLRDMGAGQAAPGLAQQITAALPRAYRSPEGTQFLLGAFEKSRGVLASMVGHGANVLNITDQSHARAAWSAMDTLLAREVQRARDQGYKDPNSIANYLSQTSPFFGGTNVNMLQQYIQRMEHGRGIGAQITLSRAQNVLNQRMAAASRKVVRYSQLTGGDLKAKNLVPVYRNMWTHHLTSQAGAGNILAGYRDEGGMGKFHALNEFTTTTGDYYTGRSAVIRGTLEHFGQLHSGPGDMGTFNLAKERKAKEAFIAAARKSHFLSSSQIQELEQAKPFDVQSTLQRIMQAQSGPKVSVGTQVGTITVELGKQAQGLLTLVKERQTGTANGSIQRNHTGG